MTTGTAPLTRKMIVALTGGYLVKGIGGVRLVNPAMHPNTLRALTRRGLIGDVTLILTDAGRSARREHLS